MGLLAGKRILLGLGGGIAAYKGPELVRRMQDAGADVRVVLTAAGARFVSKLSLEVVSQHSVADDLWTTDGSSGSSRIVHTDLAKDSDLVVLAPATADLIGKIRHGLADDLLTTTVMASRTPVLVCPAMNTEMLANPLVQDNIAHLRGLGRYTFLEPGVGLLACGITGPGRQPDPPDIIEAAASVLTQKDLVGVRAIVSAGPTFESLDPVRYLGNRSTGTMGFALARALAARGASVTLVAGPVSLRTPVGIARRVDVETAEEMLAAIDAAWSECDFVAMTAAVADYRPAQRSAKKIKKREGLAAAAGSGSETIESASDAPKLALSRTPDILHTLSRRPDRSRVKLLGFAAETHDVIANATAKLREKDLDWILANDVGDLGVGFGTGDNRGTLVNREGTFTELARAPKERFAERLVDLLAPALSLLPGGALR